MNRDDRNKTIRQLKEKGFRKIKGFSYLYINENGEIFNLRKGRFMKVSKKNQIKPDEKYLSVPKLILEAFRNHKYRPGQIVYLDGDRENITVENVSYKRVFSSNEIPISISDASVLNVIRCYFDVESTYNVKNNLQTKMYLNEIAELRGFYSLNQKDKYIDVFKGYLNIYSDLNSLTDVAKSYNLSYRDCKLIVNRLLDSLINEVLQDLERGVLKIKGFKPKEKTKTEIIKEYNKGLIERGVKPIPTRSKSNKQRLREYQNRLNELKGKSNK